MKNPMFLKRLTIYCRFFIIIFGFHLLNSLQAQTVSESQLKVSFVYNFLKNIDWPNESSLDTFRIDIFGNDQELSDLFKKLQSQKIKNKPIRVNICASIDLISNPNILFITNNNNYFVKEIFLQIKEKNTVLVTDHYPNQQFIMINFITSENGKLQFEMNTRNLEASYFHSSPKLVLLGGSEVDVRKLYQETEKSLVNEKEKSSTYQKELAQRKLEIDNANQKLSQLNNELTEQQTKIQSQKSDLNNLVVQNERQQQKLDEKNLILSDQQAEIRSKEKLLHEEKIELLNKQSQIEKYSQILTGQKSEIDKRQLTIKMQKQTLSSQINIIKTQKKFLYILASLLVIIIILSVVAYKNYIIRREKHLQLELANQELSTKNSEIQEQASKLEEKNHELEKINYELNVSRSEILEQKEELGSTLNKLTETQQQLVQSEKMASLGILVAGIAHEINNPINFINSGISGLEKVFDKMVIFLTELDKVNPKAAQASIANLIELRDKLKLQNSLNLLPEVMDNIKLGVERTIAITNGLRLYSHIDKEEKSQQLINEIIDTSLLLIKSKLKGQIEIKKEYNASSTCTVNPAKLSQVFINILSNAIDSIHEKEKPEQNQILIRTREDDTYVIADFIDTGLGIAPEKIDKIFDPFFTTKNIGKGTGLGLSISHGIIEELSGRIIASNNLSGGAIFTVEIPKNNS